MIPSGTEMIPLFDAAYLEPVDATTQVSRLPGTVNAPCLCDHKPCAWPFCQWKEKT